MRLSSVLYHLLVFISVLSLTRAQTTSAPTLAESTLAPTTVSSETTTVANTTVSTDIPQTTEPWTATEQTTSASTTSPITTSASTSSPSTSPSTTSPSTSATTSPPTSATTSATSATTTSPSTASLSTSATTSPSSTSPSTTSPSTSATTSATTSPSSTSPLTTSVTSAITTPSPTSPSTSVTTSPSTASPSTSATTTSPSTTSATTSPPTTSASTTSPPTTSASTVSPPTTSASTVSTTASTTLTDPCYNYTVLDDPWRATTNQLKLSFYNEVTFEVMCDQNVFWHGWYRLFIQGQSAQMPDKCVDKLSCGTHAPLWLNSSHPRIEDGVVTRGVCAHWNNNCCYFRSNPIKVKACPGNYYVYEFVSPTGCYFTYCAAPLFYPFGSAAGDTRNTAVDDGGSSVIPLLSPFLFFGRTYQQIYVNNNGHLTFNQPSSQYVPYSFPAYGGQDIIAGLWTNLDNRARGVVSYHQYTNGSVLTRATLDINNHFPNLTFNASWVFVATWDKVAYYNLTSTETSLQVVLISGSNFSFILMNYGDIAVTGHPVEAGYDTVNSSNYFMIPGSNNGSLISNLKSSSNVNVPGRWAFRVDSGPKSNKDNTIGLQGKLSSFLDLTDSGNIQIVLQQIKQELVKFGLPRSIELKLRKLQKIKP